MKSFLPLWVNQGNKLDIVIIGSSIDLQYSIDLFLVLNKFIRKYTYTSLMLTRDR